MKSILNVDTSWTFHLSRIGSNLGKSDVITTQHFTPFYHVTMKFCSGGVKTASKRDLIFGLVRLRLIQIGLNHTYRGHLNNVIRRCVGDLTSM